MKTKPWVCSKTAQPKGPSWTHDVAVMLMTIDNLKVTAPLLVNGKEIIPLLFIVTSKLWTLL